MTGKMTIVKHSHAYTYSKAHHTAGFYHILSHFCVYPIVGFPVPPVTSFRTYPGVLSPDFIALYLNTATLF